MQIERRKGNDRAARAGRGVDAGAELELQIAAFVIRRIGKLEAERQLARGRVVHAAIDVPAVMTAFAVLIDGVLHGLELLDVEAEELRVQALCRGADAREKLAMLRLGRDP